MLLVAKLADHRAQPRVADGLRMEFISGYALGIRSSITNWQRRDLCCLEA